MAKNKWKILLTCLIIQVMLAGIAWAEVFTYTDETVYLNELVAFGYSSFHEGFEDDGVWGGLRTPATASEVTNLGITWTSNHPLTNDITTGSGAAVSGNWGLYDRFHGSATGTPEECDVDNPPPQCLPHDGFSGTRVEGGSTLYGIGGWLSGTSGAKITFILDQIDTIQFDIPIGNPALQPQFFGVIETAGFRKYEVREIDGKIGQELYIFGDDFTFAVSLDSCIPSGSADTNCDGIDDDCSGVADDGYIPDSSCGVGICQTNNMPSSCVGGVEMVCQEGLPVPEDGELVCSDSLDNDCDGLVDSADPSCPGEPPCTPTGSADSNCDGIDDDCNGVADDGYIPDSSCGVGICRTNNVPSSCVGGVEIMCQEGSSVSEDTDPVCSDTLDNDCDGLVDSADPSCPGENPCVPTGSADTNCDGIDDDCSGMADDGYVPDSSCGVGICRTNNVPSSCVGGVEIMCQEGSSVPETTDLVCSDSLDNDCDGLADSADLSCTGEKKKFPWTMYLPVILGVGNNRGT